MHNRPFWLHAIFKNSTHSMEPPKKQVDNTWLYIVVRLHEWNMNRFKYVSTGGHAIATYYYTMHGQ